MIKFNYPRSTRELEKLYKSVFRFLIPLSVEETYFRVASEVKKLVDAEFCSIFLKNGQELKRVYSSSKKLEKILIRKNGYTYRAFISGKPTIASIEKIERFHPEVKDMGIKSTIYIPLIYKRECVGVISADSFKSKHFRSKELALLKLFGTMATLAIRQSQLHSELNDSLRTRDLFISLASHELRSPLTTISSYGQLMNKAVDKSKKIEKKWVKILNAETRRLILMVNELLQLDMIKTGKLQYNWKSTDLFEVLKRVIINFEARFPTRKLVFKNEMKNKKCILMADFDKLMQVFLNVLNNSAKFSREDTVIYLTLSFKEPFFNVLVEDKGKGIPRSELGLVLKGFYKGSNTSTVEGIGLGLFLTKTIVEMHSGKINIDSSLGEGTKVTISLPELI